MATKKEGPVADESIGKLKVKEKPEVQPTDNETKGNVTTVKAKMKQEPEDLSKPTVTKVNLDSPVEATEVIEPEQEVVEEEPQEQIVVQSEDTPVLEEVTNEEVAETVEEAIVESMETGKDLPENIQKLMHFMEDTGGDLNDYLTLNQDYSELDNHTLLKEYYKSTKPHLSEDEVDFVMEDTFAYDEDMDEDRDVKRKKLAMKEQVAEAKLHLESVKSKYYEDIKSGSKLTEEQQNAMRFFNEHNERSDANQKMSEIFKSKTESVFNDKFKGFEYNVGDKKFRFNVKDTNKVKTTQSDINNFIGKFLNKDEAMEDARGYHKGLFTAMNPDQVANHFYEQGKADALKSSIAKSKNVSMDPRQSHVENVNTSGFTVRALNNDNTPDFKFKIKNK
jgi:hypothetical protein|tara:strand:- start:168 stop:1343 length:1176 start_codon:yes stop_codon:yes gene_type:complete